MQIESEVQTQHKKTVQKKAAAITKQATSSAAANKTNESLAERNKNRRKKRDIVQEAKRNAASTTTTNKSNNTQRSTAQTFGNTLQTAVLARPPSKKAIKAAVAAMEDKGFQMPEGMQMVISFAPKPQPTQKKTSFANGAKVGTVSRPNRNYATPAAAAPGNRQFYPQPSHNSQFHNVNGNYINDYDYNNNQQQFQQPQLTGNPPPRGRASRGGSGRGGGGRGNNT
jgi:hypothetical protein